MKKSLFIIAGLALIVAAIFFQNCSSGFEVATDDSTSTLSPTPSVSPTSTLTPTPTPSTETPTYARTDFMTGLQEPWDLAFTPDGAMFFTEKCRGLSVRKANGSVVRLFGTNGSALVTSDFFCEGQTGMHGVAISPNFAANREVFVYMPSALTTPRTNRVVRLVVASDYNTVSNRQDIITDIAFKNVANNWGAAGSHSGGRLRFGPDGFLYVTTGDNHNGTLPQDRSRLGGKVLRVTSTGAPAPNNNSGSGDPRIYTYGHRNVQGISFRPGSGRAYVSEHGPNHSDEVTPLTAGGNGGWDPAPEAGVTCADNYCGYTSNKVDGSLTPMTDAAKFSNTMAPLWRLSDSQGMGPCEFISSTAWKAWQGRLAVGIMGGQRVDLLQLDTAGTSLVGSPVTLNLPSSRARSIVQGPDSSLYIATDSGSIWKVTP
jgi:aldose sugar dehydrogenase